VWCIVTAVLAATLAGVVEPPAASARTHDRHRGRPFDVSVLSSRADTVTGGDALVRVQLPSTAFARLVRIEAGGVDVTDRFEPAADRSLIGLVDDLPLGTNRIEVRLRLPRKPTNADRRTFSGWRGSPPRRPVASVRIVNHPAEGPVFSGPHIPMYCSASGPPWNLGPVDENCHVEAPVVSYVYRTAAGTFEPLPAGDSLPDDVATTVTSTGHEVPYVVRVERGTINRAVYETAILHAPGTPEPSPLTGTDAWNDRLVYTFGGACGIGYHQGSSTGGVLNDTLLRQGYATASATFNVYAQSCNDVVSAETAMMVKERFVEAYGVPDFTMGWGGSAGTMQQLLIANAYPGIIDGVIGSVGYPDERSTTVTGHDCRFVTGAIEASKSAGLEWTAEQELAVTGFAPLTEPGFGPACVGYMFFDGVDYPFGPGPFGCPPQIPAADVYDPVTNPGGIRCAMADFVSNVYGIDPATGFGRPMIPDNVGVQYGLQTLEEGTISVEQFLDLNDRIGGIDVEGQPTTERSQADLIAIERAYATGRVNQFTGGLTWTPIITTRQYTDFSGDFHDRIRDYSMRERLVAATGGTGNFVSWTSAPGPDYSALVELALTEMDAWLTARTALEARRPHLSPAELTRRSRPEAIADGCLDGDGEWIHEPLTLDPGAACNQLYPFHSNPRMIAGGPVANDTIKCQLTQPAQADYGVEFTGEEWERLLDVFGDGVCDWTLTGTGEVPLEGLWLRF
jgi:hypothetical protein